jgi:hypothetical protein
MFCKNCGNGITNNDKFCNNCGTLNDQYVEGTIPSTEPNVSTENTFMNEQPFTIEEVAQKVEEKKEEPVVVETPVEPTMEAPVEAPKPTAEAPSYTAPTPVITPAAETVTTTSAPAKKSNTGFIIILIALIVIILGIAGFIGFKMFGGSNDTPVKPNNNSNNNSNNNNNNNSNNNNSNNNNSNNNNSSSSTFTVDGYKYTVPSGFILDSASPNQPRIINGTTVATSTIAIGAFRYTTSYTYDQFKNQLEAFANSSQSSWESTGYDKFVEMGEATISGKKILYVQRYNTSDAMYADVFVTELPDKTLLIGEFYYLSEKDADPGYNAIASLAKTAVKDSSFNGTTSDTVDFSKKATN